MFRPYTIYVYWKEILTCEINVSSSGVGFKNFCKEFWKLPFGIAENASMDDLNEFFEERCFPRERANCKQILHDLGLDYYEPEQICRKTHGLQFDDYMWLQFSDEKQVTWNEIKLRD